MTTAAWLVMASALVVTAAATSAAAQTIASRVDAVRDGTVQMTFPTRPGVCSDGHGSMWIRDGDAFSGNRNYACVAGPVRVSLGRTDGQTISIRSCVACRTTGMSDGVSLGDVPAADAAHYLLGVARTVGGRNADEAISAAAFADAGNLAPDFTRLIRDDGATLEGRKNALFWLGQTGESSTELVGLDASLTGAGLREQYTFVLSQRRDDPALDKLMEIARRDPDARVRKQAMFWLGQSRDPKVIQFFKDVLRR